MTRYTYQHLLELVDGDHELIALLVDEGEIVRRDDGDVVHVDVERVLVTRTLYRELEVNWPGIEVILRLREELGSARRRLAELEGKK